MEDYRKMAEANQRRGREIIAETQLVESWEAIGAQANLIGSLSTGLMMKKLDIDMHVYTDTLSIKESFRAAARIASHPGIVRMEYTNPSTPKRSASSGTPPTATGTDACGKWT
ncbi:MAG: hypothetical protein U0I70_00030 [Alistipes inops]|nr:hypothetical protein [Alistipes inops]